MATARKGEASWPMSPTARLSQPLGVPFMPGVPVSMKSWASKCERVGSGEPTAWTMPSRFSFHSGSSGAKAGWRPKPVPRSSSASSPAARAPLMARRGRSPFRVESSTGGTAARPSMAPRWKMATRTLRRRDEVEGVPWAASAARVMNPGPPPTPRVKRAMPPVFRKNLRVSMVGVSFSSVEKDLKDLKDQKDEHTEDSLSLTSLWSLRSFGSLRSFLLPPLKLRRSQDHPHHLLQRGGRPLVDRLLGLIAQHAADFYGARRPRRHLRRAVEEILVGVPLPGGLRGLLGRGLIHPLCQAGVRDHGGELLEGGGEVPARHQ